MTLYDPLDDPSTIGAATAALELGVTVDQVTRLARAGRLRAIRTSYGPLYHREEVAALAAAQIRPR